MKLISIQWRPGNLQYFMLMLAIMVFLPFHTLEGQTELNVQFTINDFVVNVDDFTGPVKRLGLNRNSIKGYLEENPQISFGGSGNIILKGNAINVTFRNIKIKIDQNNRLIATSGEVKSGRSHVNYSLDGYLISLIPKSLVILPKTAKASVAIKVPLHSCSEDPQLWINMNSDECTVHSDGSVSGENFSVSGQFRLKKSVYTITASNTAPGTIKLGNKVRDTAPQKGAYFSGNETNNLFSVKCFIDDNPSGANFTFELLNPVERKKIEYNTGKDQFYYLQLKEGSIDFSYDSDTLKKCFGEFPARVKIPNRFNMLVNLQPNETIDTFDLKLYTDISNALFDSINLYNERTNDQYIFNLGPVSFKPGKYKAWLYFPKWMSENSSSYDLPKEEPNCEELSDHLLQLNDSDASRHDRNPGLTITRGTMYLKSPQIDYWYQGSLSPEEAKTVKSYFSGYLTFTPYGLQGSVSSNGNTFVPFNSSMDKCEIKKSYSPATWDEITSMGDRLPEEINELFRIEKLRILQMKLIEMPVCKDRIQTTRTNFRYYVHFPYPSYLDIEFEDKSFDLNGRFHQAYGPLSNMIDEDLSYRESVVPTEVQHPGKPETIQVPTGYFIWAWRLPVTFADRGIKIDYATLRTEPEKSITIMMQDQSRNTLGEIYGNELSVYPLYSDSSAFRKGVRFKGFLSIEGMFKIDSWDTKPFFGKYYSRKFKCDLSDIALADLASSPTSRPFDFKWDGKLQFPFFCGGPSNSWQPVYFQIKDLEPFMPAPINIARTSWQAYLCVDKKYKGSSPDPNPGESMTLTINNLIYQPSLGGFTCSNVIREETNQPGRLELFSYSHALFIMNQPVRVNKWIKVTRSNDCKYAKVSERIIDAISSDNISDLVCWDTLAAQSRNSDQNDSLCCGEEYYYGTYQIVAHNINGDSTITLSASNAKYYPFEPVNSISLENSTMIFKTGDNQIDNLIDIPGMQLVQTEDGYYGAFGSTYTDLAFSLPYEGEFRFFLDPKCGYFYTLGAGSFTYAGITFRGQVFIFHAPFRVLDDNPFHFYTNPILAYCNTTPLLEDMAIRSLSSDEDFMTDTQLDGVGSNTLLSGMFSTGGASLNRDLNGIDISLQAGLNNYLYHSDNDRSFKMGIFGVAKGTAKVDLSLFSVGVDGEDRLSFPVPSEFDTFSDILAFLTETDLSLSGRLTLTGCMGIEFLGECCASVSFDTKFSNAGILYITRMHVGGGCK